MSGTFGRSRCPGCSSGNLLLWALPIVLVVGCGGSGGSSAGSLPAAAIRLVSAESSMVEGGELVFDLELRPAPGSAVTVRYTIKDEADVTDANGGVVSVGASGVATIRLGIIDDDEIEAPREALTVELVAGNAGYILGSAATVTVEIEEGVCDRTPTIRDRLVSVARVDHCADVTGTDLSDIGDFYTGRLSTVQKDDLMGLSSLYLLGVCWHEAERYAPRGTLATLPEGFFDHVPGMLELSISGCAITELPDNILSGMPNLGSFFLSEPVTRLPDFSANTRLETLTVDHTALTQLPADAFSIQQLKVLYLQTNERLGNVAPEAFRGLPELTHLSLINSPVAQVPVDLLSHLPALKWLQLANVGLSTLPEGFVLPRGLSLLNLNENPFSLLPPGLFDDLPELTDLRISYAAALHIHPGMFRNLTALEELGMIQSGIRDLPPGIFSGLRGLKSVWLGGNELTSLPEGLFNDLVSLEAISLDGNPGAPFAVEVGLERIDASNTAGSPARIRLKADAGFPITDTVPITTVNGSASADSVQFQRGASPGPEVVVTQGSRTSATHVTIGPLSTSTTPSSGWPRTAHRRADRAVPGNATPHARTATSPGFAEAAGGRRKHNRATGQVFRRPRNADIQRASGEPGCRAGSADDRRRDSRTRCRRQDDGVVDGDGSSGAVGLAGSRGGGRTTAGPLTVSYRGRLRRRRGRAGTSHHGRRRSTVDVDHNRRPSGGLCCGLNGLHERVSGLHRASR